MKTGKLWRIKREIDGKWLFIGSGGTYSEDYKKAKVFVLQNALVVAATYGGIVMRRKFGKAEIFQSFPVPREAKALTLDVESIGDVVFVHTTIKSHQRKGKYSKC